MLRLYYTTSTGYKDRQEKPILSLGGFVSSTLVQNDVDGNLFDEISLNMMADPKREYRAIVLINEGTETLRNFSFFFEEQPTSFCTFKIGATLMNGDTDKGYYMERIPTGYSKPMSSDFDSATQEDPASIGDLEPGLPVGIWIERTINEEAVKEEYDNVAEKIPGDPKRYRPIKKEKEEAINLRFTWDD